MNNGIEANITNTSIRYQGKILYIGDGCIDLFGNYKELNYVLQAKFRGDTESYISPKDVREFIAVLMQQPTNTVGFFVSNAKFSTRSQNIAKNSKLRLILCNEENIVDKIKEAQVKLENADTEDICIEDVTTLEGVTTNIFGIEFNGPIRIGRIRSKNSRVKPY